MLLFASKHCTDLIVAQKAFGAEAAADRNEADRTDVLLMERQAGKEDIQTAEGTCMQAD